LPIHGRLLGAVCCLAPATSSLRVGCRRCRNSGPHDSGQILGFAHEPVWHLYKLSTQSAVVLGMGGTLHFLLRPFGAVCCLAPATSSLVVVGCRNSGPHHSGQILRFALKCVWHQYKLSTQPVVVFGMGGTLHFCFRLFGAVCCWAPATCSLVGCRNSGPHHSGQILRFALKCVWHLYKLSTQLVAFEDVGP